MHLCIPLLAGEPEIRIVLNIDKVIDVDCPQSLYHHFATANGPSGHVWFIQCDCFKDSWMEKCLSDGCGDL